MSLRLLFTLCWQMYKKSLFLKKISHYFLMYQPKKLNITTFATNECTPHLSISTKQKETYSHEKDSFGRASKPKKSVIRQTPVAKKNPQCSKVASAALRKFVCCLAEMAPQGSRFSSATGSLFSTGCNYSIERPGVPEPEAFQYILFHFFGITLKLYDKCSIT